MQIRIQEVQGEASDSENKFSDNADAGGSRTTL